MDATGEGQTTTTLTTGDANGEAGEDHHVEGAGAVLEGVQERVEHVASDEHQHCRQHRPSGGMWCGHLVRLWE